MNERSAVIIIDTGFSLESLQTASKIIATIDVRNGNVTTGLPYLTWEHNADALNAFAGDDYNHGSMVLSALMRKSPEQPVILVRAYEHGRVLRTAWENGKISKNGWTEAYLTAVHICKKMGLTSVANLSFGGHTHAADGTGWESFVLGSVTGPGKPGHIVVAGAGTGTGDNIHASWVTKAGRSTEVTAFQQSPAMYNFWCAAPEDSPQFGDWLLEVFLNGRKIGEEYGCDLIPNFWNNRRQVTFHLDEPGEVKIRTTRFSPEEKPKGASHQGLDLSLTSDEPHAETTSRPFRCVKAPALSLAKKQNSDDFRFDCWIHQGGYDAKFVNHKDAMVIAEPAIFPHVIGVGLQNGTYSANQNELGAKPDILIEGDGPISFRLPEVVADIADQLAADPTLDVEAILNGLRRVAVA